VYRFKFHRCLRELTEINRFSSKALQLPPAKILFVTNLSENRADAVLTLSTTPSNRHPQSDYGQ
jgi:hypothetical protein